MPMIRYVHISLEIWGCIFCLIAALCVSIVRKIEEKGSRDMIHMQLCNALLLCADAFAWGFRGAEGALGYWMVRISNFMVFASNYVLLFFVTEYIKNLFGNNNKNDRMIRKVIYIINGLALVTLVISQFTHWFYAFDAHNFYYRNDLFWMTQIFGIVGMLLNTIIMTRNRKQLDRMEYVALMSYIVLPVTAIVVQLFLYGIALLNIAITVSVLLMFISYLVGKSKRAVEQERKLSEAKVHLLQSQIQPHFLFNSLSTIKYLCRKEPQTAAEAIDEFAGYLRGSMDALTQKGCVTLEKEMELVKSYLYLEEKRFGDSLKIVYDIQTGGFLLPTLSIQTLAENAVRHGIRGKMEGGTLTISAWEEEDCFQITVMDDGAGFCVEQIQTDGKEHVGLENVRDRLRIMCNGILAIQSKPGAGTKVTLSIPKEHAII